MEQNKTEIILRLYARLKQSPCTIEVLTSWKERNNYTFSTRSLYRYINELSDSLNINGESIEVFSGPNNKKTWKLIYDDSASEFSLFDINTLYLVKHFIPKGIHKHRRNSFDKLEALLYHKQSKSNFEYMAETNTLLLGSTHFWEPEYNESDQELLEKIISAVQKKKKIKYASAKSIEAPFYEPVHNGNVLCLLCFISHYNLIHICAYNETTQKVCIFPFYNLTRYRNSRIEFNPKQYMPLVNIYLKNCFGLTKNITEDIYDIELVCNNKIGKYFMHFHWHSTQTFAEKRNGEIIFNLRCGINYELVNFITCWSPYIYIKSPEILKTMIIQNLNRGISLNTQNVLD